jgi:hypothetical protein
MRKSFPSEFTWSLYVALQVATLTGFLFVVVVFLTDGQLLEYTSFYKLVTREEAEANCARKPETGLSGFDGYWDRERCTDFETGAHLVRRELSGIKFDGLAVILILFVLAFVVPFAVVRVPAWIWDGWRHDRS